MSYKYEDVPSLKRLRKTKSNPLVKLRKRGGRLVRLVVCPWKSSVRLAVILRKFGNR